MVTFFDRPGSGILTGDTFCVAKPLAGKFTPLDVFEWLTETPKPSRYEVSSENGRSEFERGMIHRDGRDRRDKKLL